MNVDAARGLISEVRRWLHENLALNLNLHNSPSSQKNAKQGCNRKAQTCSNACRAHDMTHMKTAKFLW